LTAAQVSDTRYDKARVLDLAQFRHPPARRAVAWSGTTGAGEKHTCGACLALLEAADGRQWMFNGTAVPRRAPASLRGAVDVVIICRYVFVAPC